MDTLSPSKSLVTCPMKGWISGPVANIRSKVWKAPLGEARSGVEEGDCSDPPRVASGTQLLHPPFFPPSNVLRDSCDDRTSYPTPRTADWWVAPR